MYSNRLLYRIEPLNYSFQRRRDQSSSPNNERTFKKTFCYVLLLRHPSLVEKTVPQAFFFMCFLCSLKWKTNINRSGGRITFLFTQTLCAIYQCLISEIFFISTYLTWQRRYANIKDENFSLDNVLWRVLESPVS